MNHPNLLRIVRSCAKWRGGALLVATLMLIGTACKPADGAEPRLRLLASSAPGDSLRIGLTWGSATRATGYRVTVSATATNGTWTGLPSALAVPGTAHTFTAVNAAWDSVSFTATVESVDLVGPTGKTVTSAPLRLRRRAGTPGPITWDTSATIVGVQVKPDSATILLGSSRVFCGFKTFGSGHVAMRSADVATCDSIYQRSFTTAQRQVSAAEQIHEDTNGCYTWTSSNVVAAPVTAAPCSGAARVDGLQISAVPADHTRFWYTARTGPVLRLDSTYVRPDGLYGAGVTCLRPGVGVVTVTTAEGREARAEVHCRERFPDWVVASR